MGQVGRARYLRRLMPSLCLPRGAAALVEDHLVRLHRALPASGRVRRGVTAAVADGLACAVEARIGAGETAGAAARAALDELGDPDELAARFAAEIAPSSAHRTGLALLASGPLVGAAWIGGTDSGMSLPERIATALAGVPLYPVLLAFAVPASLIAIAARGPLLRRVPALADHSCPAALAAVLAGMVGDVMLVDIAVRAAISTSASGWLLLGAPA
jgi:hypothetical protein